METNPSPQRSVPKAQEHTQPTAQTVNDVDDHAAIQAELRLLRLVQQLHIAGAIVLTAILGFTFMALISYHSVDSGWSYTGASQQTQNLGGALGALISDVLLSSLGILAYTIPWILGWHVWRIVLKTSSDDLWVLLAEGALRLVGALLLMVALTGLIALRAGQWPTDLPFSLGGILGGSVMTAFEGLFGFLGAGLMLVGLAFAGLTLYAKIQWLSVMDAIGGFLLKHTGDRSVDEEASVSDQHRHRETDDRDRHDGRHPIHHLRESTQSLMHTDSRTVSEPLAVKDTASLVNRLLTKAETVLPDIALHQTEPMTRIEPSVGGGLTDDLQHQGADSMNIPPPVLEAVDNHLEPSNALRESVASDHTDTLEASRLIQESAKPIQQQPIQQSIPQQSIPQQSIPEPSIPEPSIPEQAVARQSALASDQAPRVSAALKPIEPEAIPEPDPIPLTPKPCISLLELAQETETGYSEASLRAMGDLLEVKLKEFGIQVEVISIKPGPVVTQFELSLAPGVKASKITNLARDLARSLSVMSVRVVEVIPGKPYVGIEIPNQTREMVRLSQVLSDESFQQAPSRLALALGHDIGGKPVIADLAKMPHLLVAGTTGSGKSVGVNVMLLSLLFKSTPKEVRLILVDPKMLELSVYEGIPHLLAPVITDMNEAANGLRWCGEMERRYKLMAALGVRNLAGFNQKIETAAAEGQPILDPLWTADDHGNIGIEVPTAPALEALPSIVVVIDEFADMMMIVGKKVEQLIARIAQKARAAGIHLVLATQRPSVDVITGLIKANIPTRMAFQVSSKIDSRTIIDQGGAEQLLGHGDMLYVPPGTSVPIRVHGAFVDDHEVHNVVDDWKKRGKPDYLEGILDDSVNSIAVPGLESEGEGSDDGESEPLYDEAVAFVIESRKASISAVQRKLRIGYNRAARLIETMEAAGVVSAAGHNGMREVLVPKP